MEKREISTEVTKVEEILTIGSGKDMWWGSVCFKRRELQRKARVVRKKLPKAKFSK
jgi:hypothetical protein